MYLSYINECMIHNSFIREQNELEIEKAKALTQVEVCACNSGFHSKYLRSETILVVNATLH